MKQETIAENNAAGSTENGGGKIRRVVRALTALALAAALVGGCATPKVVDIRQPQDEALVCADLDREIHELDDYRENAEDVKGVTALNVVALIFFWPALIFTYINAGNAIDAANDREDHLADLKRRKPC